MVRCCLAGLAAVVTVTALSVDARADEQVLLRRDAAWRWQTATAPRIPAQIGAMAVSALDVVAGRKGAAPASPLGPDVARPEAWPFGVDRGAAAAIRRAADDDERVAVAFGVAAFELTEVDQGFAMLELRARYEDGIAVWLNGMEVLRQAAPGGGATALAPRPHGPEWETFYVPVGPGVLRLGANTLAIELHPSARRGTPSFAAELVARRTRGLVRGPHLAEVDATTATIVAESDPDVDATLEWGMGGTLDRRATSRAADPAHRRHVWKLDGLPANARVSYRVRCGATDTPRRTFHTMPPAGATLRIGVYGDVRGGHATHARILDQMLGEGLDLVAVTGDLVLRGSDDADWQRFFALARTLLAQLPYYPAAGNHDVGWDADRMFVFPAPPAGRPDGAYWYSRDVADVHLVFLDSNAYERSEQEAWLERDLAAARARGARAILAFTHDGPYSRGYHGGNALARARYVPILVRHRVDALFAGHDHIYQRGEIGGLRYVVTGGGGASLYQILCGTAGTPACKVTDGMAAIAREHHYVVVTISSTDVEMCVRRVDGSLLERCTHAPVSRR
ncbi:MAG: metallophosphoesterase [Deltaproteobacteria bacterium]|nr:metallophosphoesterase [Deltaproteobacteria bacterium]